MAISRDVLNKETNARFWAQTGYKPNKRLDPNNPLDKAKMPVWMDIFRKVKAEVDGGTLVTTYDHPAVAQPLAEAQLANTVAAAHVDAAAKATDPWDVQANTAAATTATQVAAQKTSEAAANQPPTVSPKLEQDAARKAAKTPPPPHAPAADHIAHAQTQTPQSPPREIPPKVVLYKETNERFWNRTRYKPHQPLDMSNSEDRRQSAIWMEIFREVQREANEGRLTFTSPELTPLPAAPSRPPAPPPPLAPRPPVPPMQRPMGPPIMQQPMWPAPMQQPIWPPMQHPMEPPMMQQPMWPPMQHPGPPMMQQPMGRRPPMMRARPGAPTPGAPMPGAPTPGAPPTPGTEAGTPSTPTPSMEGSTMPTTTEPTTESVLAEAPSSTGKWIVLGVLGLAGVVTIIYVAKRKPAPRSRARVAGMSAAESASTSARPLRSSSAEGALSRSLPPPHGGRP